MEEVAINPTTEPSELTQDWKQTLGGHKQNLVCTRTQKKGAVTPLKTDPDLPIHVQKSQAEAWVGGGLLQGAVSVAVHAWHLLKGVIVIFIPSTIVWPTKIAGREHSSTHQQKIGLKIY